MPFIPCTFSRSGFSGERVFRITFHDGEYTSIAPIDYCINQKGKVLAKDEPPRGGKIEGFVEVEVLSIDGDVAIIELPDGQSLSFPVNQVQGMTPESAPNVPVR